MKKCENCNIEHDGSYATGRFCSKKCSKGFSTKAKRSLINEIVSKKLKQRLLNGEKIGYCKINNVIEKYCRNCGNKLTRYNISGVCKKCHYDSPEYRKILSNAIKGKTGGYRKGSGKTKGEYYKEQYFDSPFEIEIAKQLDLLNIKWKRNTKRFYYIFNNEKSYYIPDFYLIDYDLYFETKGYWYDNKKEKTLEAVRQNKLNWKVLMYKDWLKDKNILKIIL